MGTLTDYSVPSGAHYLMSNGLLVPYNVLRLQKKKTESLISIARQNRKNAAADFTFAFA